MESAKYLTVVILLLFAIIVPLSLLVLSYLFSFVRIRPRPIPDEEASFHDVTYECGMATIGGSWVQFNFRFYFFALMFVIFDVEAVFLFPWAARFLSLGMAGFLAMLIFIALLLVGFLYEWRKGVLEWR